MRKLKNFKRHISVTYDFHLLPKYRLIAGMWITLSIKLKKSIFLYTSDFGETGKFYVHTVRDRTYMLCGFQ
jgi:hypothetical protein